LITTSRSNQGPAGLDEPEPMIGGVFEPPESFVLSSIARHKLLVFVTAVAVALIAVGYGLSRPRSYTAAATLQVGQVNPNSAGFYGYVQSASALATAFSRSIEAEPVLATIQQKLGLAPGAASARLSAAPIPVSPAFRVIATGPTSASAIALANVTASAVTTYESQSNSANPETASLLGEYRKAAFELQRASTALTALEHAKAVSAGATAHAQASKTAAAVRVRAIGNSYVAAVTSQAPRSGLVSLIAGATNASSDRRSKIQILGFIGLLAGLVIGCLAAVLLERIRRRRRGAGTRGQGAGSASF
jgi:uncharacterized protein involved in exopolysaccharide biosynthesis